MKARRSIFAALLSVMLLVAIIGAGCAPASTPTAAPQPTAAPTAVVVPTTAPVAAAFDIKTVMEQYLSSLPADFGTIAPAALNDQIAAAKPFLLDVRETSEVKDNGFIEGSVNIPMRTLTQNLDKLPAKDQPIVTYCAIGHRGAVAMMTLQLLGYTNVKSLVGGFKAWTNAKMPVATGTEAAPVAGKAPDVDKDLFTALDKYVTTMPADFYTIAPAALNDQIAAAKPFILDVREPKELTDNGYIADSVNIPIRTTFTDFAKIPQDKTAAIVTYCAIGHRGAMEMMALQLMGYTNVKSLVGGFKAWTDAKMPVAGAPAAAAFDIKPILEKYVANLPADFGTISPAALSDQMAAAKPFILDVRESSEITQNGYIEGEVNIPMRTLTQNLDKLPAKDQPIVTYCAIGHRGAVAMMTLQLLGYTNVKSLVGGFKAWTNAKMPVVKGTPAAPAAGKAPDVDKDMLALLDKYVTTMPADFYTIAPAALSDQIAAAKPFLLDVRETSEVKDNGTIADSVNIPMRSTLADMSKLPQDKAAPVVTYCAIGHRGAMEMMALQLLGYTNVKSLLGGFGAWKAAKLPVA